MRRCFALKPHLLHLRPLSDSPDSAQALCWQAGQPCNLSGGSVSFRRMSLAVYHVRGEGRALAVMMVLFLCVCVLLQMLGVPGLLLNPSLSSDTLGASVLEGFTILPAVPALVRSSRYVSLSGLYQSVHVPLLASVPFHPPVL